MKSFDSCALNDNERKLFHSAKLASFLLRDYRLLAGLGSGEIRGSQSNGESGPIRQAEG